MWRDSCSAVLELILLHPVATMKRTSLLTRDSTELRCMELPPDKLEVCYPLCAAQSKEGLLVGTFVPEVFNRNWRTFIEEGDGALIGIFSGNTLCGLLGGIATCDSQTGSTVARVLFYYLRRDVRTAASALTLFRGFQRWAAERSADALSICVPENPFRMRLDSSLKDSGFRASRITYTKQL